MIIRRSDRERSRQQGEGPPSTAAQDRVEHPCQAFCNSGGGTRRAMCCYNGCTLGALYSKRSPLRTIHRPLRSFLVLSDRILGLLKRAHLAVQP